ncbi:MAG TPA: hypothetical protein VHY22_11785 [Chthoniobacteraceae bacterium]|jgi:hypothetical protein|nr:hypothetical protein [Chthoniobacteraceae bacterium]
MSTNDDFLKNLQNANILWTEAKDSDAMYEAVFDGEPVKLRLNDFPDEIAYTLFVRDEEFDLEERPKGWHLAHANQA